MPDTEPELRRRACRISTLFVRHVPRRIRGVRRGRKAATYLTHFSHEHSRPRLLPIRGCQQVTVNCPGMAGATAAPPAPNFSRVPLRATVRRACLRSRCDSAFWSRPPQRRVPHVPEVLPLEDDAFERKSDGGPHSRIRSVEIKTLFSCDII